MVRTTPAADPPFRVRFIVVGLVIKFLSNWSLRFIYPYSNFLAEQMNLSESQFNLALALTDVAGIAAPIFGPLGTYIGQKRMAVLGLVLLMVSSLCTAISPVFPLFIVCRLVYGLGLNIMSPAVQSLIVALVPARRVGRATGVLESSWSLSALIGFPIAGQLLNSTGWRSPFLLIGGLFIPTLITSLKVLPTDRHTTATIEFRKLASEFWHILHIRRALIYMFFIFTMQLGQNFIMIYYGSFLQEEFKLSLSDVGWTTFLIGGGEFFGAFLSTLLTDKIGLFRFNMIFTCFSIFMFILFAFFCTYSLTGALSLLFFVSAATEGTFVTSIGYGTVVSSPHTQALYVALIFALLSAGRTVSDLIAEYIWEAGNIKLLSLISAACIAAGLTAVLLMELYMQYKKPSLSKTTVSADHFCDTADSDVQLVTVASMPTVNEDSNGSKAVCYDSKI